MKKPSQVDILTEKYKTQHWLATCYFLVGKTKKFLYHKNRALRIRDEIKKIIQRKEWENEKTATWRNSNT